MNVFLPIADMSVNILRASQILELSRNEKMTLECWSHAPACSSKPCFGKTSRGYPCE